MKKISTGLTLACFLLTLSNVSKADITYGVGITWVLEKGVTVGARLFSGDEEDIAAASLGIDYEFNSKSLRPTGGVAYLWDGTYAEINLGYNFAREGIDLGYGVGYVDTEDEESTAEPGDGLPDIDTDIPM